jgi:hypothetical protein
MPQKTHTATAGTCDEARASAALPLMANKRSRSITRAKSRGGAPRLKFFVAISLGFLLSCCVPRFAQAQQSSDQLPIRSPRLLALEKQLKTVDPMPLDNFWREVKQRGTPLVEQIPGDDKHVLVTFLWRGDKETRNVIVFSSFTKGHPCCTGHSADQLAQGKMTKLEGTDVWSKTIRLPYDARFTYYLSPNDSLVPDPGRTEKDWTILHPWVSFAPAQYEWRSTNNDPS